MDQHVRAGRQIDFTVSVGRLFRRNREDDDVREDQRERDEEAFVHTPRSRAPRRIPVAVDEGEECLQEVVSREGPGGEGDDLEQVDGQTRKIAPVATET